MKYVKIFIAIMLCIGSIFSISGCYADNAENSARESRIIQEAKLLYFDSALIICGTCTESAQAADDKKLYAVTVDSVVVGDVRVGNSLPCSGATLAVNEQYLLFLSAADDGTYAAKAYKINGNFVAWDAARSIEKSLLESSLRSYSSIVFAPTSTYFYSEVQELLLNTDSIIIGKVVSSPVPEQISVKSQSDSVYIENDVSAIVADIIVYGTVKGSFVRRDKLRMVCTLSTALTMTDALTLGTIALPQSNIPPLSEGSMYLFFLVDGPDSKQTYYFPVNPVQGWVSIIQNEVDVPNANTPFSAFDSLTHLVTYINVETKKANAKQAENEG